MEWKLKSWKELPRGKCRVCHHPYVKLVYRARGVHPFTNKSFKVGICYYCCEIVTAVLRMCIRQFEMELRESIRKLKEDQAKKEETENIEMYW